ncbi:MAG: cupin domain-containing protein [Pseudohongiella sp.]|nr:cupin domain-containing protein [Pseudohongiella sp.]
MSTIFPKLKHASGAFTAVPIGEVNGSPAFARVMEGFEGPLHLHNSSDEMFVVLSGVVYLDLEAGSVKLEAGDSYTVPAGVTHKSRVPGRAELIVIGGKD